MGNHLLRFHLHKGPSHLLCNHYQFHIERICFQNYSYNHLLNNHYLFRIDLWNKEGERVTEKCAVVAETVIFTSFAPTLEACTAGGESWLYQMSYDDGGMAPEQDSEDPEDRSVELGEGIASYPVVDLAQGTVVVQLSDARINVAVIQAMYNRLVVRSWQENFDNVY